MPITANLCEALLRLRDRFLDRIIWIDAICINQNDDREKEHQIQLMAHIYGRAGRVVVWLGQATDDSEMAFAMLRNVESKKSCDETETRALRSVLERPWFRRIWVWLPPQNNGRIYL